MLHGSGNPPAVMNFIQQEEVMPIYEYVCRDCGQEFEQLVFNSREVVKCRKCGSGNTEKKMSLFAMKSGSQFRGTGKKGSSGGCKGCTATSCSSCSG